MRPFRLLILIILLAFAYYAGSRGWGTDFLTGWMEDMNLSEMLGDLWNYILGWFSDQELGDQVGEGIEGLKDTLSL